MSIAAFGWGFVNCSIKGLNVTAVAGASGHDPGAAVCHSDATPLLLS